MTDLTRYRLSGGQMYPDSTGPFVRVDDLEATRKAESPASLREALERLTHGGVCPTCGREFEHAHGDQPCDPSEEAALRQFGREFYGDDPRNRCDRCGRVVVVGFVAPPDLWLAAAGTRYEHEHLCITCFDELVPRDWAVYWDTVTTLWPISRARAEADRGR